MDLRKHYQNLYEDSLEKIKSDNYQIDNLIDSFPDNRFGLTLIIRPSATVKNEIQKFLKRLKSVEPNQYYYPNSDIHVTVMSIISCYNGFDLSQINPTDYVNVIQNSLKNLTCFEIEFDGVTVSPSCIMVQGFLNNNTLNFIRDKLRLNFKQSELEQTIDKRYSIQTAHSTISRLRKPLTKKAEYLELIEEYRSFNFGKFPVETLELVYNDWYHKKEHIKELHKFKL